MKKRYYIGIIIGLMFICIVPIGKSTSGSTHLSFGSYKKLSFSVKAGDIIKGEWSTSPYTGMAIPYRVMHGCT